MMKDILVIDCKGRENFWNKLSSNHAVSFATTAYEGLNLLSKNTGLIFLNQKQLESSDMEVLRLIKKAYPLTEVVILTSCGVDEPCTDAIRKGSGKCLSKPLSADEMIQKVKDCIVDGPVKKEKQYVLPDETSETEYYPNVPSHIVDGVLKVRDYIIQNYSESISLGAACKMASTSKTYFCHYFKKITGHSLRNYHHLVKVQIAEELRRDRRFSIADVAIKLGYNDSNYFSTIYKRFTGMSPKHRRTAPKGSSENEEKVI